MPRGKVCKFRVGGVAFVRNVGCKDTGSVGQQTFLAHAYHMLDDLPGAQVVAAGLFGTVGVIEDHDVESQLVSMKGLPRFLR
jgi:hypothetical protein